jgi:hypothetical protein
VAKRVGGKLEIFIPITKVDEENRLVYGTIAAEEVDNSGEIFDYESSKPNFEKWSDDQYEASDGKSKGNVRAMHTSKAAGKLTDISYNDDTKTIEGVAKIVDGDEWEKVLEGVYTGFSMGGRYAKRWNDNGTTRYTAQPVEVSIVDKPCIKSALFDGMKKTFMLQKADGTIEERPFANKGDAMFVPTNDQILPVAQALAKAAGKTEADWLEFSDAARDQLVAEHDPVEKADEMENAAAPEHTDEDCAVENCDKCMAAKSADAGEQGVAKAAGGPDEGDHSGEGDQEPAVVAEPVVKAEAAAPVQGWQASDGTFFAKKTDCAAHNEKLAKGDAAPTLAASIDDALATVAALAKGETVEAPADEGPVAKSVDTQLLDLASFIGGENLAKGMYEVSTLTSVLRSAAQVYVAARNEKIREGDDSAVPAQLLSATETLGEALIVMATEEVGEMLTQLREGEGTEVSPYYYPECCYLAAGTIGLEKADADEFFTKAISISGKDQARLQKIHDHASALGAECNHVDDADDAEVGADAGAEKMAKAAGFESADAFITDLQKRAAELDEIKPKVEELTKFISTLKTMPRPAAPTTAVAVEKAIDANGNGSAPVGSGTNMQKAEEILAGLKPEEIAQLAIKLSHQSGGVSLSLNR